MWVSMVELEDLLGKDKARVLTASIGGIATYIPQEADISHNLAKLITLPGMQALCAKFGKSWITLPNGRNEPYQGRILKLLGEGRKSRAAIAAEVGCTERYVYMVATIEPKQQQLTLPM